MSQDLKVGIKFTFTKYFDVTVSNQEFLDILADRNGVEVKLIGDLYNKTKAEIRNGMEEEDWDYAIEESDGAPVVEWKEN